VKKKKKKLTHHGVQFGQLLKGAVNVVDALRGSHFQLVQLCE
jgi:hypothetical protein